MGVVAALLMVLSFNPPEDSAAGVVARIECPAKIEKLDEVVAVRVVIENTGEAPVNGTARVRVIEPWSVKPRSAEWTAGAGAKTALNFELTPGEGTYNALYPVHAYVEFSKGGEKHAAHSIAIVEYVGDVPARLQPGVEWRPIEVAAGRPVRLTRMPVRRTVIRVNGEPPAVLPPGWHGSEGRTRAAVTPGASVQRPDAREAIGIHPPWYNGLAGTALVEFPLRLPDAKPVLFTAATAIRDTAEDEPPSDGVTFRVRVAAADAPEGELGEIVFERHSAAKSWEEVRADLSRYAGQQIRLQLESHPGPQNNTTCDASYWAEPTVTAGELENAIAGRYSAEAVRLGPARVTPGRRGLLDARVEFENGLAFTGFDLRVLGDTLGETSAVNMLAEAIKEPAETGVKYRHRFSSYRGAFDVVVHLFAHEGAALRAKFSLENGPAAAPWSVVYLEDVAAGPWPAEAERVYAGVGNVLVEPEAFDLHFDGHRLASSFVGFDFPTVSMVQAVDSPPSKLHVDPAEKRYSLHSALNLTMTFIPAPTVWEGVKTWREINGLNAAPSVDRIAGKFVFDLWGGHYADSAEKLEKSFALGMTNSVVIWHNWQRWGYDYRLPEIWPPNPKFGTLDEFQRLAQVCADHGVLFAPHDNYIDVYPDAECFSYDGVAFTQDGRPIRGWFNGGRGAQAYRWLTEAYRDELERNVKLMRDNTAASAYFIDVWSSIGPFDSWTSGGRFLDRRYTRDAWADAFNWIRDTMGGNAPQISESGHDQLIGALDGATANHLRVDAEPPKEMPWTVWPIECKDAERIPWLDFAHHDRFVLHGAGYSNRYRGGLDEAGHGIYSDDYICTEVLTGHPGMTPAPFSRDGVRKYWLLDALMRKLAGARMANVEFDGGDIHRQHVVWENGAEVWVNRGEADWEVAGGRVLPQYGLYARAGDVEAAVERRDGAVFEWSRSPDGYYVNARGAAVEIGYGFAKTSEAFRAVEKGADVEKTPLPD